MALKVPIAEYDGEVKAPHQVPKGVDAECPDCGGRLRVWSGEVVRHFKHVDNMGESGGESHHDCGGIPKSEEHKVWKSYTADALLDAFDDRIATLEGFDPERKRNLVLETELDAPVSEKSRRVGDVVVQFDERDPVLGDGIVVEVQHKHESKDTRLTTADYLAQDYAVVWVYSDDFSGGRCRLDEVDFRHRARQSAWPDHVPDCESWESDDNSFNRLREQWHEAWRRGDWVSGASATLPPDWNDEKARELWENRSWRDLFTAGPVTRPVLPPGGRSAVVPVTLPESYDLVSAQENVRETSVHVKCTDCDRRGKYYKLFAGESVCPHCEGELRYDGSPSSE